MNVQQVDKRRTDAPLEVERKVEVVRQAVAADKLQARVLVGGGRTHHVLLVHEDPRHRAHEDVALLQRLRVRRELHLQRGVLHERDRLDLGPASGDGASDVEDEDGLGDVGNRDEEDEDVDDVQLVRELGRQARERLEEEEAEGDDPEEHELLVHALDDLKDVRLMRSVVIDGVCADLEDDGDHDHRHRHHLNVLLCDEKVRTRGWTCCAKGVLLCADERGCC